MNPHQMYEQELNEACIAVRQSTMDRDFFLHLIDYIAYIKEHPVLHELVENNFSRESMEFLRQNHELEAQVRKECVACYEGLIGRLNKRKITKPEVSDALEKIHALVNNEKHSIAYIESTLEPTEAIMWHLCTLMNLLPREVILPYIKQAEDGSEDWGFSPTWVQFQEAERDLRHYVTLTVSGCWLRLYAAFYMIFDGQEIIDHLKETNKWDHLDKIQSVFDHARRMILDASFEGECWFFNRVDFELYLSRFHYRFVQKIREEGLNQVAQATPSVNRKTNTARHILRCGNIALDTKSWQLQYQNNQSVHVSPETQPVKLAVILLKKKQGIAEQAEIGQGIPLPSYSQDMTEADKLLFNDELHAVKRNLGKLLRQANMPQGEIDRRLVTVRNKGMKLVE
jgi:hypothetical protein